MRFKDVVIGVLYLLGTAILIAVMGWAVGLEPRTSAQSRGFSAYPVPGNERGEGCLYLVGSPSVTLAAAYSPYRCPQ